MKRFFLIFLGVLLLNTYVFAQSDELWLTGDSEDDELPNIEQIIDIIDEMAGDEELSDVYKLAEDEELPGKDDTSHVLSHTPIKVVPGLPNPNSRKVYRIQVGAYAVKENADIAERELKAAGFETRREKYGSLTRVLAVGFQADEVRSAVNLIESLGFGEVWIRE